VAPHCKGTTHVSYLHVISTLQVHAEYRQGGIDGYYKNPDPEKVKEAAFKGAAVAAWGEVSK
jgi:hypothetical protein